MTYLTPGGADGGATEGLDLCFMGETLEAQRSQVSCGRLHSLQLVPSLLPLGLDSWACFGPK